MNIIELMDYVSKHQMQNSYQLSFITALLRGNGIANRQEIELELWRYENKTKSGFNTVKTVLTKNKVVSYDKKTKVFTLLLDDLSDKNKGMLSLVIKLRFLQLSKKVMTDNKEIITV